MSDQGNQELAGSEGEDQKVTQTPVEDNEEEQPQNDEIEQAEEEEEEPPAAPVEEVKAAETEVKKPEPEPVPVVKEPEPEPAPVENTSPKSALKGAGSPRGRGGRKAQRTRRVQIKPAEENQNEEEEESEEKESKPEENHVDAAAAEEEEEDNEEGGDEQEVVKERSPPAFDPSKIIGAFVSVFTFFGSLARKSVASIKVLFVKIWELMKRFACFLYSTTKRVACFLYSTTKRVLPFSLAMGIYSLIIYLVATYCVNEEDPSLTSQFSDRIRCIVRASVWTNFPTVLGLLINCLKPNAIHGKFVAQSLEDTVLQFFNTLVLATYLDAECFHWVWVYFVVSAVYRSCHWMTELCDRLQCVHLQYALSAPLLYSHIGLGLYNVYQVCGQDLGYLSGLSAPPPPEIVEPPTPGEEDVSDSWF